MVVVVAAYGHGHRWVAARGHLVVNTMHLCTMPRPLGLVDSGSGGCDWCPLTAVIVIMSHCGCWWVMAQLPCKLHIACFCVMLGLSQVDNGGGGGIWCLPIAVGW